MVRCDVKCPTELHNPHSLTHAYSIFKMRTTSSFKLYTHLPRVLLLFPHLLALHEACKQECRLQCLSTQDVSYTVCNLIQIRNTYFSFNLGSQYVV